MCIRDRLDILKKKGAETDIEDRKMFAERAFGCLLYTSSTQEFYTLCIQLGEQFVQAILVDAIRATLVNCHQVAGFIDTIRHYLSRNQTIAVSYTHLRRTTPYHSKYHLY